MRARAIAPRGDGARGKKMQAGARFLGVFWCARRDAAPQLAASGVLWLARAISFRGGSRYSAALARVFIAAEFKAADGGARLGDLALAEGRGRARGRSLGSTTPHTRARQHFEDLLRGLLRERAFRPIATCRKCGSKNRRPAPPQRAQHKAAAKI